MHMCIHWYIRMTTATGDKAFTWNWKWLSHKVLTEEAMATSLKLTKTPAGGAANALRP